MPISPPPSPKRHLEVSQPKPKRNRLSALAKKRKTKPKHKEVETDVQADKLTESVVLLRKYARLSEFVEKHDEAHKKQSD